MRSAVLDKLNDLEQTPNRGGVSESESSGNHLYPVKPGKNLPNLRKHHITNEIKMG